LYQRLDGGMLAGGTPFVSKVAWCRVLLLFIRKLAVY
jgi:hypothetical protein